MFDAGILLIGVLHGVLISLVGRHFRGDFLGNNLADLIGILSANVSELLVKSPQYVAEALQFRFRHTATAAGRHRFD